MKIRPKTRAKYTWYRQLARDNEPKSLTPTPTILTGVSPLEAFHQLETYGQRVPCNDGPELDRYLADKMWHGVTVTSVAEDYINRLVFSAEIKRNYPSWVANEIFKRRQGMHDKLSALFQLLSPHRKISAKTSNSHPNLVISMSPLTANDQTHADALGVPHAFYAQAKHYCLSELAPDMLEHFANDTATFITMALEDATKCVALTMTNDNYRLSYLFSHYRKETAQRAFTTNEPMDKHREAQIAASQLNVTIFLLSRLYNATVELDGKITFDSSTFSTDTTTALRNVVNKTCVHTRKCIVKGAITPTDDETDELQRLDALAEGRPVVRKPGTPNAIRDVRNMALIHVCKSMWPMMCSTPFPLSTNSSPAPFGDQ